MEFLSIGTLMSFTMVAAAVIILRYQSAATCQFKLKSADDIGPSGEQETPGESEKEGILKGSQVRLKTVGVHPEEILIGLSLR